MNKRRRHTAKRRRALARYFADPNAKRYWRRFVAGLV